MSSIVVKKVEEPRFGVDLGSGKQTLLTQQQAFDLYVELGTQLGVDPPEPQLEDVLSPTQFMYDGDTTRIARQGYVIGLSPGKGGFGVLVDVIETWNDRDGHHAAPLFKHFKAADIYNARRLTNG